MNEKSARRSASEPGCVLKLRQHDHVSLDNWDDSGNPDVVQTTLKMGTPCALFLSSPLLPLPLTTLPLPCSETMILEQEKQSRSFKGTYMTLGYTNQKCEPFYHIRISRAGMWLSGRVHALHAWDLDSIPGAIIKLTTTKKGFAGYTSIEPNVSLSQCGLNGSTQASWSKQALVRFPAWEKSQGRAKKKVAQKGCPDDKQPLFHDGSNMVNDFESSNTASSKSQGHLYL